MVQIFSARTDRRLRRLILFVVLLIPAAGALGFYHFRSASYWGVGSTAEQPIGFRHDLHVAGLGLDCSYCHTGAASAASAGMPTAETCLGCHSHLWRGTQALQPLFTAAELNQPIQWKSLYRLPEHTRFHHGAHAAAGISCAACHGEVAKMQKTTKEKPMSMRWCLDCHQPVGEAQRHRDLPDGHPEIPGVATANPRLTDCSTCHY